MANSHDVVHPDPDSVQSIFLKLDGGVYYAYVVGRGGPGSRNILEARAKIFPDAAAADACLGPDGTAGWASASYPAGIFQYQFGTSDGAGTVPNAQQGNQNFLVVFANFQGSPADTWVKATHSHVQFNGFHSRGGLVCRPDRGDEAISHPRVRAMRVARKR